jgi:subtilisin family serine protease
LVLEREYNAAIKFVANLYAKEAFMQFKKFWSIFILLVLLTAASQPALAAGRGAPLAPLYNADSPTAIPGRYIVVFKTGAAGLAVEAAAKQAASDLGAEVFYTYSASVNGFAAALSVEALDSLRRNPSVDYVEADQVVMMDATQTPATWGLDRIDQRYLPLNNAYTYNTTASGVNVYIIDTGIRITHSEFGGRASVAYDAVGDGQNGNDCNGHGTHVAGTVGGSTYGVAKGVRLYAVRVLNCTGSGTTSGVIAGVDWVTKNHSDPAVANMSLGGGASTTLDTSVKNSITAGVTYAVSAGNSNQDACKQSPARVTTALTVGATTSSDARASYSNYGKCLDVFAPGSSITSAWNTNDSATNTISGTSMASPHVAGAAALYLATHAGATPATVASAIVANATKNVVTNPGRNSPNLLLYSLIP